MNGKVCIYPEGRYAINYPTFEVGAKLNIQQQNILFNAHKVMLDGGIIMLVKGLLTYRISHVEKLIKQIGANDVARSIENVAEAEISRVFSSIHLEQIATSYDHAGANTIDDKEGESRSQICHCIIAAIKPIVEPWGVMIINFQINSLTLADELFAKEYACLFSFISAFSPLLLCYAHVAVVQCPVFYSIVQCLNHDCLIIFSYYFICFT